jgi:uncharacterized membrane protein YphA (DoxX/SURF4 family)
MAADAITRGFGWRVFGLGVIALGVVNAALGGFPLGAVPADLPDRAALGYAACAFLVLAGLALQWRRTAAWAAAAVAAYYAIVVLGLTGAPVVLKHYREFLAYFDVAEPVAIIAGAVIIFAAKTHSVVRAGQIALGACAVYFGAAHFLHMELTAPLVPKWLPPSQVFWGYATGVGHIAAGLALISGVQARLAAILLTVMYASFTPLVHVPLFLANPHSHRNWMENATNIVLTGSAWVVADALARRTRTG